MRDELAGGVFAAAQHLDGADHFAGVGQPLHGVQMGEDAAVVDGSGRRQHGEHLELATQQLNLGPRLEAERLGHVGPDDSFVILKLLDRPLRGERLGRGTSGLGPQAAFLQPTCLLVLKSVAVCQAALRLELALRQDAGERDGRPSSSAGTQSLGESFSTPVRPASMICETCSSGSV